MRAAVNKLFDCVLRLNKFQFGHGMGRRRLPYLFAYHSWYFECVLFDSSKVGTKIALWIRAMRILKNQDIKNIASANHLRKRNLMIMIDRDRSPNIRAHRLPITNHRSSISYEERTDHRLPPPIYLRRRAISSSASLIRSCLAQWRT